MGASERLNEKLVGACFKSRSQTFYSLQSVFIVQRTEKGTKKNISVFFPFYSVHGPWMILIAESNSLEASTKFSIRLIAAHNRVYSLINKILPQVTLKTKHVDCECEKVHRNRMEWDEESVEDDTMTSIHIGHLIDTIYCINPLHLCTFTSTHIYGI